MRYALTFMSILSIVSTTGHAKSTSPQVREIVCSETLGGPSDDASESDFKGLYTIGLDANDQVTQLKIERNGTTDMRALRVTLTPQNSTLVHDVRKNDPEVFAAWGIEHVEAVEAKLKNGDDFILRINDHSYAGPKGSRIVMNLQGLNVDSSDVSMIDCEGELKFPDPLDLELEKMLENAE